MDRRCRESEGKAKIEGYMSVSDEEAHQRVADSWHSLMGSSAIMILIAFFKADLEPYPTNKERQEWAAWYLHHNPLVCNQ